MKEYYQKAIKKLTWFWLSNLISFNEQGHEKQKEPETSDQSLIRLYKTDKVQILVQLDKVQLYIHRKEGVKEYSEILWNMYIYKYSKYIYILLR